jgi:hypothetical protein
MLSGIGTRARAGRTLPNGLSTVHAGLFL